MYSAPNSQLNRELYSCTSMSRITTYLYFNNFLFNWCPIFIKCKECFVHLRIFNSCVDSNLMVLKMYPY